MAGISRTDGRRGWFSRGKVYGHWFAQKHFQEGAKMKKFGFLALALTLSVYSLGCSKPTEKTPAEGTTPAAEGAAPAAEGAAPAAEGAAHAEGEAAHGEAGHEHAEGEAPAGETK
jgi:hypothetical protein